MKLIIQIPCYNEEPTLPQTVADGSSDRISAVGPGARYQARIGWLIPTMALLMLGDALVRRRADQAPGAGKVR